MIEGVVDSPEVAEPSGDADREALDKGTAPWKRVT